MRDCGEKERETARSKRGSGIITFGGHLNHFSFLVRCLIKAENLRLNSRIGERKSEAKQQNTEVTSKAGFMTVAKFLNFKTVMCLEGLFKSLKKVPLNLKSMIERCTRCTEDCDLLFLYLLRFV